MYVVVDALRVLYAVALHGNALKEATGALTQFARWGTCHCGLLAPPESLFLQKHVATGGVRQPVLGQNSRPLPLSYHCHYH